MGKGFKQAGDLEAGNELVCFMDRGDYTGQKIEKVDKSLLTEKVLVYNFVVEDWHTYFVGGDRLWVHNNLGDCGTVVSKAGDAIKKQEDEVVEGTEKASKVYKPSPKHDPTSGWGRPNPIPDDEIGQALLDSAYSSTKNKQLYNVYDEEIVKFQPDTSAGGWHSYLVDNPEKEVPTDVLRKMLNDGKITKAQYKKFLKNNR